MPTVSFHFPGRSNLTPAEITQAEGVSLSVRGDNFMSPKNHMKPFGMLRVSMIVLGFAAAGFIAPQCRAQFEVDPDHFDGTDSWQAAALAKVHGPKINRASVGGAGQAQNRNTSGRATLHFTAAGNVPDAQRSEAVAVQNKRKASTRKEKHP
jgi:hypothetical protein